MRIYFVTIETANRSVNESIFVCHARKVCENERKNEKIFGRWRSKVNENLYCYFTLYRSINQISVSNSVWKRNHKSSKFESYLGRRTRKVRCALGETVLLSWTLLARREIFCLVEISLLDFSFKTSYFSRIIFFIIFIRLKFNKSKARPLPSNSVSFDLCRNYYLLQEFL